MKEPKFKTDEERLKAYSNLLMKSEDDIKGLAYSMGLDIVGEVVEQMIVCKKTLLTDESNL